MKRSLSNARPSSSFRFGSRLTLAAAGWLCALVLGCSRQAEGERCDTNNNNEDCESGLVCTQLRAPNRGAVCCSENPTEEVCQRFMLDDFGDSETQTTEPESTEPESTEPESDDESSSESTADESTADDTSSESSEPAPEAGASAVEAGVVPVEAGPVAVDGSAP